MKEKPWPLEEVPVSINLFGDSTKIAQALGLDIELPDVDNTDDAYWDRLHAEGWKPNLRGKVANLGEESGDPDWAMLVELPCCEVWFDLEEGIKFRTRVKNVRPTMEVIYALAPKGIALLDSDGESLVKVSQTAFGYLIPDAGPAFEKAGLVAGPKSAHGEPLWYEPPPR